MFRQLKRLIGREPLPQSNAGDRSARTAGRQMDMSVESLESRVMLSGVSLGDEADATCLVKPISSDTVTEFDVAKAEQASNETISLESEQTLTLDGHDQTLVLDLNEVSSGADDGSVISDDEAAGELSLTDDVVVASDAGEVEVIVEEARVELLVDAEVAVAVDADQTAETADVASTQTSNLATNFAAESTATSIALATSTTVETATSTDTNQTLELTNFSPQFGPQNDDLNGSILLASGHETRGPPATSNLPSHDFVLHAPLSSNTANTDSCVDQSCPCEDGSDAVCSDDTPENGVLLGPNDTLGGNQTIAGLVVNNGIVSPGNSPGILMFDNGYTQSSTGTLLIELFGAAPGTGHDQVQVTGDVSLNGLLRVVLDSTYAASLTTTGTEFVILTYTGTLTGDFADVSGLGIPGTSRFLNVIHDATNKQIKLRVDSVTGTLNASMRTALSNALGSFDQFGDRIESLLASFRQPLPVVGMSLADLVHDATGHDLTEYLDLSTVAATLASGTNNAISNLVSTFQTQLNSLVGTLDRQIISVSAYIYASELHVEFSIDLAKAFQVAGLDLNTILPTETLTQLGLEFNSDINLNTTVGVYANFGVVIDITNPTSITDSDIEIEINDLRATLDVDTDIAALTVNWTTFGSSLAVTGGKADANQIQLSVTLTELDYANRITRTELSALLTSGLAAAINRRLLGTLYVSLPVTATFAGNLSTFGKPIISISQSLEYGTHISNQAWAAPSVTVDLDITTVKSQILGLLDNLKNIQPSQLPLPLPTGFDLATLFDGIFANLRLKMVAEDLYNATEAFRIADISSDLANFRTLMGLDATFDDVSGTTTTNADLSALVTLLQAKFGVKFATGALTLAQIKTTVQDQLGVSLTMGKLIEHLQAELTNAALTGSAPLFGITLTGGYFADDQELRLDIEFDFEAAGTFYNVSLDDLTQLIFGAIDELKNNSIFKDLVGATGDLSSLDFSLDTLSGTATQAQLVRLIFGGSFAASLGLDLSTIISGSGSIGNGIAFFRLNELSGSADVTVQASVFAIKLGSGVSVTFNNVDIRTTVGASLASPSSVNLAALVANTTTVSDFVGGLFFNKTGSLDAGLGIALGSVGTGFDTARFGTPRIMLSDANLFDTTPLSIRISVLLGTELRSAILSLATRWDTLLTSLFNNSVMNGTLPLVDQSANQLIGGSENGSLAGLLSLQSVANTYFTANATTATVAGLIESWTDALGQRFASSSLNPFSIVGGLDQATKELVFEFDLNISQSFGFAIDVVNLATTGPTASIITALTNLGVTLTGDFVLDVLAVVEGSFSFVVDVTNLIASGTAPTTSEISLEMDEELSATTTITASAINFGIAFTSGSSSYSPRIENGTVTIVLDADLDLKTAQNGSATVAQLTTGPLSSLFDVTVAGTLDSRLPILGLFDFVDVIDGTFVLRIVDSVLLDATNSLTTSIEGEFAISEFLYVRGSITGFSTSTITATFDDATTKQVSLLTVGIADADLFLGINGPTGIDLDGNGTVDASEMNSNASGLVITGANIGLALMTATAAGDDSSYLGVMATATSVNVVGLPLDFNLTLTSVAFEFNYGSNDKVVDFTATDFSGNGSADGSLDITVGSNTVMLDMSDEILAASANATLTLGGFVYAAGSFAFSLGAAGNVVVGSSSTAQAVRILTIGGHNVNVSVGSMKSDGSGLDAGLQMTGTSFGIAIMSTIDPNDDNVYFAMSAAATSVSVIGLPAAISIQARNVQLSINSGSNGAVNFTHTNTTFGGAAGPLLVNTGGVDAMMMPITVSLGFSGELYEASARLILGLGSYIYVDGMFAFRRGPAQMVTLSDGTQKQVSSFTIGGTNANAFFGIGGPYQTDTNNDGLINSSDDPPSSTARGFVFSNVSFGLAVLSSQETSDNSVYYALEATVGSTTLVGIPGFGLSTGVINIQLNASTETSGRVVNFVASAFDGSDAGTDPDGFLEVLTGGDAIQINMTAPTLRVEVLSASVSVTVASTTHTIGGNFAFQIGQDTMMADQFIVGVTNITYADGLASSASTLAITNAVGVMVVKSSGFALLAHGDFDASASAGSISAGLQLVINTTGAAVNESITVGGQTLTIASAADEVTLTVTSFSLNIADFIFAEGSFVVNESIMVGSEMGTFQGGRIDLFMGIGPYKIAGTDTLNPDAVGIVLENVLVGLIELNGGYALVAEGNVKFVGIEGVVVSGTIRIEINTTGRAISLTKNITDSSTMTDLGDVVFDFMTTTVVKKARGTNVAIGIPGVFELSTDTGGYVEFSKLANGMVEVDVAKLNLRVLPQDATSERFSIQGHATFTIGRQDGFKLRYVQVYNFSIFDLDAGIMTGTDPPAELANMLGFPDVTVTPGGAPVAAVVNPLSGATVDAATLNARGFIDITYSVGTTGILDAGAEFTITGGTADLTIGTAVLLYGTTYRYTLVDSNPNNSIGLFANPTGSTASTVTVNFIAGSFTNSITSVTNAASSDTFKLLADSNTADGTGTTFTFGPISIIGPKLSLEDFSFTNGKLLLTIGLGANQVNLGFGNGQTNSGVTAQLTDVLVTFDLALGFDLSDLSAFIANPLAHVSGPSLTGKFSIHASMLKVTIPGIMELSSTGVLLAYDPAITTTQTLLTVASTTIKIIPVNLTSTITNLAIRTDGFSFDDATLGWNSSGMPISFGGLFSFSSFGVTVTDFDLTFGSTFVFTGSVTFFTDDATFLPGQAISATVSKAPGSTKHGLSATLNFGTTGSLESLQFHIDQLQVTLGSYLTLVGTNIDVDTSAWGDASKTLVSFSSIGAQLQLGGVSVGGEARNFSFKGDGSFVAGMNFAVIISVEAVTGSSVKWPSWLPIQVTAVGLEWADINADPTDFVLTLSANVTGLHNLPLTFTGTIDGIKIDIGKLAAGQFPIIGIGSIGVTVSGNLFGGQISGGLIGGILRLNSMGEVLAATAPESEVADRVFFMGITAGFTMAGAAGFEIRIGLSELGPLGVFVRASLPYPGIVVEPVFTGLAFNDFFGGVEFYTSLPDYTDAMELRNATFGAAPTDMTAAEWRAQVEGQVAAQWVTLQSNPNQTGFVSAFSSVMTITAGATVYSAKTSAVAFNGQVIVKFSTDGKIALTGTLNFANDNLSISAKMYGNLSQIASGTAKFLFLADAPDQAPVQTWFGEFSMNFIADPMNPTGPAIGVSFSLQGGMIVRAPLGIIGDVTGANVTDVEIFTISGAINVTIDGSTNRFVIDVNGTMSVVYLGTVGSVSGRLVVEMPDSPSATNPPKLWGVLSLQSGLDKLAQLGIEVNAEVLLQLNTTNATRTEVISLTGIVGDALGTVTDTAALTALDALTPVIPPAALAALPAAVRALLTGSTFNLTLGTSATIEVVVAGAKWRVYDEDSNAYYFIEEVTGGQLKVSGESQTFVLSPFTYALEIRGELIFHMPAFLPDGITPGPDVFVLAGAASMKINRDGLEAFVLGRVSVGPANFRLLEFNGQGALIIKNSGIAGGLSLSIAVTNVPGIDLTGNLGLVLNTTSGVQEIIVPERFRTQLLPTAPTDLGGAVAGDYIPASTTNTTLYWKVGTDGTTLTPVLLVPGTAPDINGMVDPMATANTPFAVIFGQAVLKVRPAGVDLLTLSGRFHISVEPTRLSVAAAYSVAIPVLGAATGTASFVLDADGMYGQGRVTRSVSIPGVNASLELLLEFNTSSVAKNIQTFAVNNETGEIGTTAVTASLAARQVRIVAGGSLSIGDLMDPLVTLTGRFEMYVNTSELAISVAAMLALGDGTISANVTGAALLRTDGIAFQILAAVDTNTSSDYAGAGFRVELGGSALVRVNTTQTVITTIAGVAVNLDAATSSVPYFDVRAEGSGLIEFFINGVGGFKIQGEISTQLSTGGFAITVNGEFTATLGGTVILRMAASGSFQVFGATSFADIGPNNGIAGRIALTVAATSVLGGTGFDISGTFTLEINTTGNAITEILGTTVNLAAGPYARISVSGIVRFSFGSAASFELRANGAGQGLSIEMNATRIAVTADATLVATVAGQDLISLSVTNGLLAIGTSGIVANITLGGSISGNLFSFSGSTTFKLNTTSENAFINNGVVLPGAAIAINGSLTLLSGFALQGQFAIELNANGLVIAANADLTVTIGGQQLVSLELIDSFLQITSRGIAARLSVGGRLSGPGFEFRSSTVMTLLVNTTGQSVSAVNGQSVGLAAGTYASLSLVGDLVFLNAITIKGSFTATVATDGLDVSLAGTLSVMDIGFSISAAARIRSTGIAFKASVSLSGGGNTLRPISGLAITGSFELQVNTTSSTQLGIAANTARLSLVGGVNVQGFTIASTTVTVSISSSGFTASFSGSMNVGILTVNVSGSFSSSGTFSVTGSVGFSVSAGPAYLNGTATVTIGNSGFSMSISGGAGIRVAGFNVGVGVNGSVSVNSNGSMSIRAEACITIDYFIGSETFCAGATFQFGSRPSAPPTGTNTATQPTLGTVSSAGALSLNLNQFGTGAQEITILTDGTGIRVSGNGYSQLFNGVTSLNLDLGVGDDYLFIGTGVAANVTINGGAGDDEIVYLGSGTATINGGDGNDEIRVVNDRNFRAEPTDGSTALIGRGMPPGHTLNGGNGDDILIGGTGDDTINGGAGNDRLDGGGGTDTVNGDAGNDIIYGGAGNDTLNGGAGNDVIYGEQGDDTLNGGAGNDVMLGGSGNETINWSIGDGADIEINGQTGTDVINISGNASANTFTAGPGENGAFVMTIDGQGLAATNFETVNLLAGAGSDTITMLDLPGTTVLNLTIDLGTDTVSDTVTVNGLPTDNVYTMAVVTGNVVVTPTGGTAITIVGAGTAAGGANVTLNSAEGDDTINVLETLAGTVNTINTGIGTDTINVGTLTGGLAAIAGALTINGDDHQDTLNFEDSINTANSTATLNATTFVTSRIGIGQVTFSGVEVMDFDFGSGNDTFTVNANVANSNVDLAAGDDTIHIRSSAGNMTVMGAAGADTFTVGSTSNTVADIDGTLTLDGGADSNTIAINNSGGTTVNDVTITNANVNFATEAANINYTSFAQLTVSTGTAADTLTIESTHAGTTTVNTGNGNDTLNVRTISGSTTIDTGNNDDTVNVSSTGGLLNSISAALTITAGGGSDTLNLSDASDAANNTGLLTSTMLTGLGMASGITYSGLETFDLDLGSGSDTFTIQSTSSAVHSIDLGAGNDVVLIESISGATTIEGQAGNEMVTVGTDNLLNNITGLLTINGHDGTNTITVSDSADTGDNTGSLTSTTIRGLGMSAGIDYTNFASLDLRLSAGSDNLTIADLSGSSVQSVLLDLGNDTTSDTLTFNGLAGDDTYTLTVTGTNALLTPTAGTPITISRAGTAFGGTNFTLNAAEGADTINVSQTLAGTVNTINTGSGADTINVGNLTDALTAVVGSLTINGDADQDTLNFEASVDTAGITATLNSNTLVSSSIGAGLVTFNLIEVMDIAFGSGDDSLTVNSNVANSTIDLASGDDTIHIRNTAGSLAVTGGAGSDTFNVGSLAPASGSVVNGIVGSITIDGQGGNDTIQIDNGGDTDANDVSISGTVVEFLTIGAVVNYTNAEALTVMTGSASDQLVISSTHTGTTMVTTANGNDQVAVLAVAGVTSVDTGDGDDTVTVGSNPLGGRSANALLDDIMALTTFHGGAGDDTLNLNDAADTNDNVGTLTATTLTGFDMVDGIVYHDFDFVNFDLGLGNDTLTIVDTDDAQYVIDLGAGNDVVLIESISGTTTIHGRAGDDSITVGTDNLLDNVIALLTVDGNDGTNTLTISDASDTDDNTAVLTATTLRGLDMTAGIDYANFAALTLTLGSGSDDLTVASTHTGTTLIDTALGDDVVLFEATTGVTTLNAGGGDDTITVGRAVTGGRTLAGIDGVLNIAGQDGEDTINIDNSADAAANDVTLTNVHVEFSIVGVTVNYASSETLVVSTGSAGDQITIESTHAGATTVHSAAGNDTLDVLTIAGQTTLNLGDANDTVNVSNTAPTAGGLLDDILALLTINASVGSDTLNLDDSGEASDNSGQLTATTITGFDMSHGIVYGDFEFLNLDLGSGNDTLTIVDTSTATHVIDLAVGNDTLLIESIAGTMTVYGRDGNDDFVIGTDDLLDNVSALLTVNGNGGTNTLTISDSADADDNTGTLNGTMLRGLDMANGIDYFNFAALTITLGSGGDTFTVDTTHVGTTLLDTAAGDDSIYFNQMLGLVTLNAGLGNDYVLVGEAVTGGRTIEGIDAVLTIDGQAGDDSILVDNSADLDVNDVTLTNVQLTFANVAVTVNYVNAEALEINTGSAADQITVQTTHVGTTTINSAASGDTFDVLTIAGDTTLNTGVGSDLINVTNTAPTAGGVLDGILALLTINASTGNDTLNVDDSGDTDDNTGTLTATTITGLDMSDGIVYTDFEFLNLDLGSGHDTLTILATSSAINVIDLAAGNDTLLVAAISGTTTVYGRDGNENITVGHLGTLDAISALLTLFGNAGTNTLTVTDATDTSDNVGQLNATMVRGLDMSDGIDYFDFAELTLVLGVGSDTFTVETTHATVTTINTNAGDDTVVIENTAGTMTLNTQDDNDSVVVEATNGTVTINGGAGNDDVAVETIIGPLTINGGDGDDFVLVGYVVDGELLPTIDHLQGVLTVNGNLGSDTLTLDDRGDALDRLIGVDGDAVSGLTTSPIGYFTLEFLNILAGSGDDLLNVRGTTATTYIELNDGDERVFVSSDANANFGNMNDIDFLTGHLDLLLGGDLNLNVGNGRHKLMISDEADTTGDTATITDSVIATTEITISGLAVSDISYGTTAGGNFADGITIWTGFGNDTISIDATHFRAAMDAGGNTIRTITSLNTGLGDDDITVTLLEGSDGFFALNSQGPYNNQPTASDKDTIDGSGSTLGLYLFGGQDDDIITGGQGRDFIFGDRGVMLFFDTLPADVSDWTAIEGLATTVLGYGGPGDRTNGVVVPQALGFGTHVAVGGDDTIRGGGGDDFLIGQNGDDTIYGDDGEDDIIGGHNTIGGPDGDDTIYGGNGADVIIGDNGTISRTLDVPSGEWVRYAAPFDDVIREVQLFDLEDLIGGNDTILGGAGDDRLFGQIGDDRLEGGGGDDELVGGLGDNTLIGDADNDVLVGGVAQIIRAYNDDGTAQLNSNGSWHRDVVLELVGTVIGYVDIDNTPEEYELMALAQQFVMADLLLVVGAFDADGNRITNGRRGHWVTRILLIDLDAAGNETMEGGDGDDVIVGGLGNDTLSGGAGNDLIIGDLASNLSPYDTDMPLMLTGIRLRSDLTGTLDLDQFGTLVVPDVQLETAFTNTTVPHLTIVPQTAPHLIDIATGDLIRGTDGAMLAPYVSTVPSIRHHIDSQPGNDIIDGGDGNDTIIGDNLTIYSPLLAPHSLIQAAMNSLVTQLANLQVALYHTASLVDIHNTHINGVAGGNVLAVGGDTISGGAGNDNIVGDNAIWQGPSIFGLPDLTDGGDTVEQFVAFHRHVLDLQHVVSDAEHAVRWANQEAAKVLRSHDLFRPRTELDRNELHIFNDAISGDDGNDVIAGDDSIVNMPIVTDIAGFRNRQKALRELFGRRVKAQINRELVKQARLNLAHFKLHIIRDRRVLVAASRVSVEAGRVSFDMIRGNDQIAAGDGNDTVAGDNLVVVEPAFDVTPESRRERARTRAQMRRILNRSRSLGIGYSGSVNYRAMLKITRRGPTMNWASDTIWGGNGDDVLVGDNAGLAPYAHPRVDYVPGRFEVRSLPKMGRSYIGAHRGGDDTIDGGAGNDKLDGRGGFDHLTGGLGMDQIYGGPQRDTIVSDADDTRVRQGGRLFRDTTVDVTVSPWTSQLTTAFASDWTRLETRSLLWIRLPIRR